MSLSHSLADVGCDVQFCCLRSKIKGRCWVKMFQSQTSNPSVHDLHTFSCYLVHSMWGVMDQGHSSTTTKQMFKLSWLCPVNWSPPTHQAPHSLWHTDKSWPRSVLISLLLDRVRVCQLCNAQDSNRHMDVLKRAANTHVLKAPQLLAVQCRPLNVVQSNRGPGYCNLGQTTICRGCSSQAPSMPHCQR